ncbi:hypothetical protein BDZ88DRAFT_414865 [Geranomyces variabilis]|nr:hypothetical protein BDZ88DRAFT_414865 [Geranomyces variabilis]KAJ3141137.1 hypothetical protein HDU90_007161 [Geranomyces variabilis]
MNRAGWQSGNLGMLCTQAAICVVCSIALGFGINGTICVSDNNLGIVAFAVGVVVQIALVAPLELARLVSQILFWRRLLKGRQRFRAIISNWSVIYSNSYRGAEDLRSIGPIGAFLMLVYLVEVAVIGAIGTLYWTVEVENLKSHGNMSMFVPIQSTAQTYEAAGDALAQASRGYFSFGNLYDSRNTQAFKANATCGVPTTDQVTWTGCHGVVASPLAMPELDADETTLASNASWAALAEGDLLRTQGTEILTTVTCEPSYDVKVFTDNFTSSGDSQTYLGTNRTGEWVYATNSMWAAMMPNMNTPQVQIITFGKGSAWEEPPVDEEGRMVFALHAFNFPDYPGMRLLEIPFQNLSLGARHSGAVLCTSAVSTAVRAAEYKILQTTPRLNVRLNSAVRGSEPTPYSMHNSTRFGYSMGIFLVAAMTIFGCDLFPCSPSDIDPPLFDRTIGLVKPIADLTGNLTYIVDLESLTANVARLMSRLLLTYTAAPRYPEDLGAGQLAATNAELYNKSASRIYTTYACNIIVAIGLVSATLLVTLHLVVLTGYGEMQFKGSMWTTSSVLFLLQALPRGAEWFLSAPAEGMGASLDRLREAADQITVRADVDSGGMVKLYMKAEAHTSDPPSLERKKHGAEHKPEIVLTKNTASVADDGAQA